MPISTTKSRNRLFEGTKLALLATVFWFVGRHVAAKWQTVGVVPPPSVTLLLTACVFLLGGYATRSLGYQAIVRSHGHRVPFLRMVGLVFVPLLGKYIPGKLWSVVSALHYYSREGVPKRVTLASLSLAMALNLLSALVVTVTYGGTVVAERVGWLPCAIAGGSLLVATYPPVFYGLGNAGLRLLKRQPIETRLSWTNVLQVLAVYVVAKSIIGVAFVLLIACFYEVVVAETPTLIAVFTFAQVAGLLAFFAPGGIGVREGVLIVGLQPIIGPGPAIVITGVARLWQTALELIAASFGWWMLRRGELRISNPES